MFRILYLYIATILHSNIHSTFHCDMHIIRCHDKLQSRRLTLKPGIAECSAICGVSAIFLTLNKVFRHIFNGLWSVPLSLYLYTKCSDTFWMVCGVFRYLFNFIQSVPTHFQWFMECSAVFLTLYNEFRHIFNGLWSVPPSF